MQSVEGERVPFSKNVKARGNVENWLQLVEQAMLRAVKHHMRLAIKEYHFECMGQE
jgi:Dynein heavy chain, N-terminal region 2